MESYLMMLYVTLEQESALKNFFVYKGWTFSKPDLSVTTDRLGPSVKDVQTEHVLSESRKSPRQSLKRKAQLKQQKVPVSKLAKISSSPSSTRSSEHNYSNMTEDTENVEQQVTLKETELQNIGDSKDGSSELNTSIQDEPSIKVEQFDITYNEDYDDGDDDNDEDTDVDYSFADAKEQNETENNEKSADNVDKNKAVEEGVKAEPSQPIEPKISQEKPYKCERCDAQYGKKIRLVQHERRVHLGLTEPFPCSYCDASFSRKSSKTRHENIVHCGLRTHTCDVCGRSFATKRLVDGHMRSVHYPESKFKCNLCGHRFSFFHHLQFHKKKCARQHFKTCDVCDETFKSVALLDSHLLVKHNVDTKFHCEKCDATFSTKNGLQKHMTFKHGNHSGCVCDACGKWFQYPASLKRHKERFGHFGAKESGEL